MKGTTGIQTIQGVYDFSQDPSAGAVGNIDLGVPLRGGSLILSVSVAVITTFTGGIGSTLSFGVATVDQPINVIDPVNLVNASATAGFTAGTMFWGGNAIFNPNNGPRYIANMTLIMGIGVTAVTAGKLLINVAYAESNL